MGFSAIADRMVWPPSLSRDRKWPRPPIRRKTTLWMLVSPVAYKIEQSVMGQKMCFSDSYVIFGVQRKKLIISTISTMKHTQYNPYLWPNRWNFRVFWEIGVEEHDGDVQFFTGSGNTAGSRMRNASGHNYWNSSFIMDMAMRQIPRSTERNSS